MIAFDMRRHYQASTWITRFFAHSSIRFTIGRFTTEEEVDFAIELVNALAMTSTEPLYDTFIDQLNTKVDEVTTLLKLRSTLRQKSEEKTAEDTSSEISPAANAASGS